MKGFIINLDIRKDRYDRIIKEFNNCYFQLERVSAIYHGDINVEQLRPRISPWNFQHLSLDKVPRVVVSSLSHQKVWKHIIKLNQPAFVFEDDVAFIHEQFKDQFNKINFNILDFDIIWLNGKMSDKPLKTNPKLNEEISVIPFDNVFRTAESYIISPKFAKILLNNLINDLGAVDAHMYNYICDHPETKCFCLNNSIFCQFDRNDTNIQF